MEWISVIFLAIVTLATFAIVWLARTHDNPNEATNGQQDKN